MGNNTNKKVQGIGTYYLKLRDGHRLILLVVVFLKLGYRFSLSWDSIKIFHWTSFYEHCFISDGLIMLNAKDAHFNSNYNISYLF